jgi:hypothetical protein
MDKIHTDLVDADAIVEGHQYETYYQVSDRLILADDYLRVVSDGGFTDTETRIPYDLLEKAGFKRERIVTGEIQSGLNAIEVDGVPVATMILGVEFPPDPPDVLDSQTVE